MLPRMIRLRLAAQHNHIVSACTPRIARRSSSQNASAAWHVSQDDQHLRAEAPPPPPLPRLSDSTSGEAIPHTSSFPLYPAPSASQPVAVAGPSRSSREQHEADLALLRSYAKSAGQVHGKGKGKGRAYVPRTAADLPADEALLGEAKKRMSARYSRDVEEYSEEQLREFYVAMVRSGAEGGEVDGDERIRRITGAKDVRGIGSRGLNTPRSWGKGWEGGMQGFGRGSGVITAVLQRALRRLSGTGDLSLLGGGAAVSGAPVHVIQSLTAEQAGDAILAALKQALPNASGSGSGEAANGVQVGLGLLRRTEWKGLLADRRSDFYGLMQTLRCMEQCSFDVQFTPLLGDLLAYSIGLSFDKLRGGRSRAAEEMIDGLEALLDAQEPADFAAPDHHALISSYLRHPLSPSRAISHLSRFAALGLPAPQSAYALVLSCLTSSHPSAPRRALAWDLFADMRLTAHPTPSLEVYRTMISACASGAEPKPEMARDLWVEMNQHYSASGGAGHHVSLRSDDEGGGEGQTRREEPGEEEFTAFIRALGSTKGTYLEAFEVMRQMLARHDEASYVPFDHAASSSDAGRDGEPVQPRFRWTKWTPTRDTWKALLEGTKRAGDVERSKWVLLEAARWAEETREEMMDEDMVASVLMAYAAFVPKRTRVDVSIREQVSTSGVESEGTGEDAHATLAEQGQAQHAHGADGNESTAAAEDDSGQNEHAQMSLAHTDEQSHSAPLQATLTAAQAIAEARGVFELVRSRSAAGTAPDRTDSSTALMEEATYNAFRITPRLVNSFLSVIYAHSASIDACRSGWSDTWSSLSSSAKPNGWSYLHALERCAVGQRHFAAAADAGAERQAALAWAKELWEGYQKSYPPVTPSQETLPTPKDVKAGTGPRQIERAWASIIRAHAIADELPAALALLLEFQRLYPPSSLVDLYNPRQKYPDLKIRFTDPTTVADPDVPPHMLWKDVDVLHHRMVRDGDPMGVGKVKMVTMGYLRALRERAGMRRREVVGGRKSKENTYSRKGEELSMDKEV